MTIQYWGAISFMLCTACGSSHQSFADSPDASKPSKPSKPRAEDVSGWGYQFDAEPDAQLAREFLTELTGEWFPETPRWSTGGDGAIDLQGYLFQLDAASGLTTYRAPSSRVAATPSHYETREDPTSEVRAVGTSLASGALRGFRPIELASGKPAVTHADTVLARLTTEEDENVEGHAVLELALCPSSFTDGIARPSLDECEAEASAQRFVNDILGSSAYRRP